jgi:uncharacterized membrane protein
MIFAKFSRAGTLHRWLVASSCFSCLLLLIRVAITGSPAYIFLPWNLFLAFIPYWITGWMTKNPLTPKNKIKRFMALMVWILFIPNSFYIITDLFHLTHIVSAPKWFDLLLIFSFAWNGILFGIISLRRVEIILNPVWGGNFSFALVAVVMWMSALGIYIGRFWRYNSWDIITDPFSLAGDIMGIIIHPVENVYIWGMTFLYSAFMTLLYFTVKKLNESFSY